MNYQRKNLSDQTDIGDPAALPAELVGLDDATLADLTAGIDPCPDQFAGEGFFPVADPPPTPIAPTLSVLDFMLLFTTAQRIAMRAASATDAVIYDFLDLLYHATSVNLGDPHTMGGVQYAEAQGYIATGEAARVLAGTPPA